MNGNGERPAGNVHAARVTRTVRAAHVFSFFTHVSKDFFFFIIRYLTHPCRKLRIRLMVYLAVSGDQALVSADFKLFRL